MKEDREALLLPDFSAHNLRHTFCTRFCENETNLKVIQDIMGHADISTTMDTYGSIRESFRRAKIVGSMDARKTTDSPCSKEFGGQFHRK